MKSLRCIAVALLLAFVCGPALIDPCLFDCHDATTAQSGVPPCHDAAAHDGTALTGASSCDHDHDAIAADAVVDVRLAAHHHPLDRVALTQGPAATRLLSTLVARSARPSFARAPHTISGLPLRL